jgi:hypothetical protein
LATCTCFPFSSYSFFPTCSPKLFLLTLNAQVYGAITKMR